MIRLIVPVSLLALTGCGPGHPPAPETAAAPSSELRGVTGSAAALDPHLTLQQWADALEARNWAAAYALWGEDGAASGMDAAAFADSYEPFHSIHLAVGDGQSEGAAGSLYFEANVVMTATTADGLPVRFEGPVTLRRVNDVPGATPEQLQWHIVANAMTPASDADIPAEPPAPASDSD